MTKQIATLSFLALIAFGAITSAATITNGSFEQPVTATFIYNPTDPTGGWTFNGRSGVASNTFFAPPPPDGTQAAFLQQYLDQPTSLSSITQSLSAVAPSTIISFYLAQRAGFTANPVVVSYAGTTLGTFTPGSTSFTLFSVNLGAGAPASGVLAFTSAAVTNNNDLDTAIDLVSIAAPSGGVPEPSSAVLSILALGILAFAGRRLRAAV